MCLRFTAFPELSHVACSEKAWQSSQLCHSQRHMVEGLSAERSQVLFSGGCDYHKLLLGLEGTKQRPVYELWDVLSCLLSRRPELFLFFFATTTHVAESAASFEKQSDFTSISIPAAASAPERERPAYL